MDSMGEIKIAYDENYTPYLFEATEKEAIKVVEALELVEKITANKLISKPHLLEKMKSVEIFSDEGKRWQQYFVRMVEGEKEVEITEDEENDI